MRSFTKRFVRPGSIDEFPTDRSRCAPGGQTVRDTYPGVGIRAIGAAARSLLWAYCGAVIFAAAPVAGEEQPDAKALAFFETRIRPLLNDACLKCHGEAKQEGGLRLDSRRAALTGGDSGPLAVGGMPETSLLVDAINYGSLEMPPSGKLADRQIEDLTRWVRLGLPWPGSKEEALAPRKPGLEISDEDRRHWSFQPIGRPAAPNDPRSDWDDANPIDGFVFAKLAASGLSPAPEASKRTLIRRAFFDLIGLPPTPAETARFLADDSPTAFERVVDDLLARPRYGERWGRHWLDVVRFAQTNGYERDDEKPFVWRYRDYVIRSFNEDKPYDRFVLEQLAGDEVEDVSDESIIATGFYHLGVWDDEPDDKPAAIEEGLDDVLRTTGETFLGLTIGCARCHDHKFDPIPQADYYRMLAFIRNIAPYGKDKQHTHWEINPDAVLTPLTTMAEAERWRRRQGELKTRIDQLRAGLASQSPDDKKKAEKAIAELEKEHDAVPFEQALSVREPGPSPGPTRILIRGNHLTPGEEVQPAFLGVLGSTRPEIRPVSLTSGDTRSKRATLSSLGVAPTSGRRRALGEWIVDPVNPLTARVLVNRLWQHHFGRGIVSTPNDFGRTGRPATHPKLLDWLAGQLIDGGWRIKSLHRQIMLSRSYRQASQVGEREAATKDPENRLLWRQNLRRLDAEALRDAMLATSGRLNPEMGGRGVFPALSAEVLSSQSRPGAGWDKSDPRQRSRRSVYVYTKRTLGVPMLEAFDAPVPDKPEPNRQTTTIAPQALILLNGAFVREQSVAFAERLRRESGGRPEAWVELAFRIALARAPTEPEKRTMLEFHQRRKKETVRANSNSKEADRSALVECCRLILNLNEFIYVD